MSASSIGKVVSRIVGQRQTEHIINWLIISRSFGIYDRLPLIGQLLGHTQPQTTQRYAQLAAKPVRLVNDAVGEQLAQLLSTSG